MTDTTEVTGADLFEVRKLKGMSQTEVAKKVSYSTAYVCHLEKAFRPVHAGIVRLYEERLGVELGAIVKRRNLMISITTLGFVESLPRLAAGLGPVPMVAPEGTVRVGAAEVESMWDVQEFLVKSDHRNGGVAVVDYVVPALNRATRLMHGTMTDAIRRELCTAVSALANRCSWIYYDAGDWKKSSDCVRYAITANEFQNPSIRIRSIEGAAWCLD
jgi:transcriptional regulator with XRE-family HTH domain